MTLSWTYLENIAKAQNSTFHGVYLIVHHGTYNRVLYVGTSNWIGRRIQQHYKGYQLGFRTVWKVTKDQDVYIFMSSKLIHNYINHFKKLAANNKVWASTTIDKFMPQNLLDTSQEFDSEWKRFVAEEYLPNIGIWAMNITPYNAKQAVLIESAIQQRIVKTFELGRFFNHMDLSVLGKIEFNNGLIRIRTPIENTPDLDNASNIIFQSLSEKKIPEVAFEEANQQLKEIIEARRIEKQKRANKTEKLISNYPNHGKQWENIDVEKLRVMLVDFNLTPKEMAQYLGRMPSSIQKKIDNNDKLTNKTWRRPIRN